MLRYNQLMKERSQNSDPIWQKKELISHESGQLPIEDPNTPVSVLLEPLPGTTDQQLAEKLNELGIAPYYLAPGFLSAKLNQSQIDSLREIVHINIKQKKEIITTTAAENKEQEIPVNLGISDQYLDRFDEVVALVKEKGMTVQRTLRTLGIISGTISINKATSLKSLPGIAHFEPPRDDLEQLEK